MEISVNGKTTSCPDRCSIQHLLMLLEIPEPGTAAARNDVVVRKALYAETILMPGDRIEIIRAVAGG